MRPAPRTRTPASDVPPDDWRAHEDGFEDGLAEDWDAEPDSGGYPEEEGW